MTVCTVRHGFAPPHRVYIYIYVIVFCKRNVSVWRMSTFIFMRHFKIWIYLTSPCGNLFLLVIFTSKKSFSMYCFNFDMETWFGATYYNQPSLPCALEIVLPLFLMLQKFTKHTANLFARSAQKVQSLTWTAWGQVLRQHDIKDGISNPTAGMIRASPSVT